MDGHRQFSKTWALLVKINNLLGKPIKEGRQVGFHSSPTKMHLQDLFHRHSRACKKCSIFTPPSPFDRKAGFAVVKTISLEDFFHERTEECSAFAKLARSN